MKTRAIGAGLAMAALVLAVASRGEAEDDSVVGAARAYVKAAQEAQKAGHRQAALEALLAAYALRPQHGGIAFELVAAYAAAGRLPEATDMLTVVAAMGFPFATDEREELKACRADPGCGAALAAIALSREPRAASTVAFTFPSPAFVPEGLAYDAASDAFFVSSVRQRMIVRLDRARVPRTFAERGAGLWSALGMAVDAPRHRLWVATAAFEETADLAATDKDRSAIVALDLESGRPLARYDLPSDRPHVLGDVIVAPSGDVFTTDSASPALYRLPAGGSALEPIAAGEPFVSLQGLALDAEGRRIFVADYSKGVFAVDLASRRVRLLAAPRTAGILGIDGLYRAGDALIGVQNGTNPPRLLRLAVSGDRITSVDVIDSGNPVATEPTLGVVVGDRFYFVANSHVEKGKTDDPVILKVELGRK